LLPVNDMDREEWLGKKVFYKKSSSRKALRLPLENVSTEISRGTISSHPVSRQKNLFYSLSIYFFEKASPSCWVVLVFFEGYYSVCAHSFEEPGCCWF